MASRSIILKNAVSLVPTLGFTRTTISQAALSISYQEGMSDRSIDALFGRGDEARKTLIRAWLEEGRNAMRIPDAPKASVRDSLQKRLEWNIPVLDKLPEAFALLATPSSLAPSIDAKAILEHPALVAHTACKLAQNTGTGMPWYTKRAILGSIYAAAELHQLTSPTTAPRFLDGLLEANDSISNTASEVLTFADYIGRSWLAIARSKGII